MERFYSEWVASGVTSLLGVTFEAALGKLRGVRSARVVKVKYSYCLVRKAPNVWYISGKVYPKMHLLTAVLKRSPKLINAQQ